MAQGTALAAKPSAGSISTVVVSATPRFLPENAVVYSAALYRYMHGKVRANRLRYQAPVWDTDEKSVHLDVSIGYMNNSKN